MKINAECETCRGSGVTCDTMSPDIGFVCRKCAGTGCVTIAYTPFTKRTTRKGVQTVRQAPALLVVGMYSQHEIVSYKEFLDGKMPKG